MTYKKTKPPVYTGGFIFPSLYCTHVG